MLSSGLGGGRPSRTTVQPVINDHVATPSRPGARRLARDRARGHPGLRLAVRWVGPCPAHPGAGPGPRDHAGRLAGRSAPSCPRAVANRVHRDHRRRVRGDCHRRTAAAARASAARAGRPSPAPTSRSEARALRQITGLSPAQVTTRPVCTQAAAGHATCAAQALVLRSTGAPVRPHVTPYRSLGRVTPAARARRHVGRRFALRSTLAGHPGLSPAGLRPVLPVPERGERRHGGDHRRFNDPTAASDLAAYRTKYGLPACGDFERLLPAGRSNREIPRRSRGARAGDQEISLDLDAVSAHLPQLPRSCWSRRALPCRQTSRLAMEDRRQARRRPDLGQLDKPLVERFLTPIHSATSPPWPRPAIPGTSTRARMTTPPHCRG